MKTTLILLAMFIVSFNLLAQDSNLVYSELTSPALEYTTKLNVNKDLGRAWLTITQIDNSYGDESYENEIKVKIEGMTYNKELGQITIIDKAGNSKTCANITSKRRSFKISNTRDCLVSQEIVTEQYDDGFNVKNVLRVNFYLN